MTLIAKVAQRVMIVTNKIRRRARLNLLKRLNKKLLQRRRLRAQKTVMTVMKARKNRSQPRSNQPRRLLRKILQMRSHQRRVKRR